MSSKTFFDKNIGYPLTSVRKLVIYKMLLKNVFDKGRRMIHKRPSCVCCLQKEFSDECGFQKLEVWDVENDNVGL